MKLMTKRMLTAMLAAGLVFTATACADDGETGATTTAAAATTTAAAGTDSPAETDAVTTDMAETDASTEDTEGAVTAMTPGTYTIEIDGYADEPMVVDVTLTENSIESIEVVSHAETDGIGTNAIEELPDTIVDTQSLSVDAVSGATVTSNAIIEAVREAISEAGGEPSDWE